MLIFISNLHFVDGSAGEHNVPADAFRIFFEDIKGAVDWMTKKGRPVEEKSPCQERKGPLSVR